MTKYKLIVSDYDGTLAGRDEIISEKVFEAIRRWEESGRLFSIATGKQYLRIERDVKRLGLNSPIIVRGGAEIIDPSNDKVVYSQLIDEETVRDLTDFLARNKYKFITEYENNYFSTFNYDSGNSSINHKPFDEFKIHAIPKIVVAIGDRDLQESEYFLENTLKPRYPKLNITRSYFNPTLGKVWDITNLSATKHLAVLELIKLLKIDREQTVGVGDNYNDFPLLEACGLKVAMGNAPDELKAVADMTVSSYLDDGVAELIDKLLNDSMS